MVLTAFLSVEGRAQSSVAGGSLEIPIGPPSRVLDAGEVFHRYPEKLKEISASLKQIEKTHGIPIYLVVYSGLIRTSVTRQAKDLFALWVGPDRDGIVVVCDTDEARVELGLPGASYRSMDDERAHISRLPDSHIVPIVRELKRTVDETAAPADYIPQMVDILTTRLDAVLTVEPRGWKEKATWKIGLVTIGLGALVGVVGFWVSRFLKQAEEKAREQFLFPDVLVRSRLGANCGGGKVATGHFAEAEPVDPVAPPPAEED